MREDYLNSKLQVTSMKNALRKLKNVLTNVGEKTLSLISYLPRREVMISIILALNFSIAVILRVMPMRWGIYLTEFDPYYEYYLARKIVEKGWSGIAWWFERTFSEDGIKDTLFWYPYGRDLRASSQPGTAMVSAITYLILQALGFDVSLYVIHAFVPAIGAAFAVLAIYLFGKRMWDYRVGLLSSLYIAITPAYLSRTMLGGKHEGLAIPFMLFSFYAYFKSVEEKSITWAVISGIAMGMVVLSWGGYIYPWNLIALFILLLVLLGKMETTIAKSYLIVNVIATLFVAITPRFGPRVAFMSISGLLPMLASLISLIYLIQPKGLTKMKRRDIVVLTIVLLVAGLVAWQKGLIASVASRIISVINPQLRKEMPIIESVSEHRVPSWGMLYDDYQSLVVLFVFGIYLLVKKADYKSMFLILFAVTSLYGAMSLARLTLLLSPALVTVASIAFVYIIDQLVKGLEAKKERKRKIAKPIKKEYYAIAIILLLIMITPSLGMVVVDYDRYRMTMRIVSLSVAYSHQPSLILTATISGLVNYKYEFTDWISALEWMRNNLPENAVVACWWDYGYWISINTNRSTLADNGTINVTQIRMIAKAFLSPEEEAIKIFRKYNVTHVVVFERFRNLAELGYSQLGMFYLPDWIGYGDFGKSYWMAQIARLNASEYQSQAYIRIGQARLPIVVPANTSKALNATLYKLIFVKTDKRRFFVFERLPIYFGYEKLPIYEGPLVSISSPKYFKLVYASYPNEWVLVFKVNYEEFESRS